MFGEEWRVRLRLGKVMEGDGSGRRREGFVDLGGGLDYFSGLGGNPENFPPIIIFLRISNKIIIYKTRIVLSIK